MNNAARTALQNHSKITMDLLVEAISEVQPSLTIEEIQRYENIKAQMNGEEIKVSNDRPTIGFT